MQRYLKQVPYSSVYSTDLLGKCGIAEQHENLKTLVDVDMLLEEYGLQVILIDGTKGGDYFIIKPIDKAAKP